MDQNQWASAVESAAVTGRKTWQASPGRMRFRADDAEIYINRYVPRRMAEVDLGLLGLFRKLASGDAPWPLYLWGPVGVGKTRAALCLCDVAEYATLHSAHQLCDAVMKRERLSLWDSPVWDWPRSPELAVLDELGTNGEANKLEYGVVKEFSDWRERSARPAAIYISNHEPGMLETLYDERIQSRLTQGTVFHLDGPDRRRNIDAARAAGRRISQ